MRVGLISDTHVPDAAEAIPPQVIKAFKGVDLILHAGDIFVTSVLDELQTIAPVLAARGDDDYGVQDERVREVHKLDLEGLSLYLTHSSQYWAMSLIEQPEKHNLDKAPDIVVFGHTHRDTVMNVKSSLLVNPGSPTFPGYRRELGTIGILDIRPGNADVDIRQL